MQERNGIGHERADRVRRPDRGRDRHGQRFPSFRLLGSCPDYLIIRGPVSVHAFGQSRHRAIRHDRSEARLMTETVYSTLRHTIRLARGDFEGVD
jgi:hypothetical protein